MHSSDGKDQADTSQIHAPEFQGWQKSERPVHHPEEGKGDRSEWITLVKAVVIVLAAIGAVTLLLSW